jgi:4-hydroxy-2-oxoheptanedioate aldolase
MNDNRFLKAKLKRKQPVLGTWSVVPSPTVTEILANAGLDFALIDMEHGPISFETAENMIRAAERNWCSPLIRVSENNDAQILRALDVGAHGVVVPQITTPEDVQRAVNAVKYSPIGRRGLSPYTRAGQFGSVDTPTRIRNDNDNTILVLILEGRDALQNIAPIMDAADGQVDVVYIGPYDLSASLNVPGQLEHPSVLRALQDSDKFLEQFDVCVGTLIKSTTIASKYAELGLKFFAYQADCAIVHSSAAMICRDFRHTVGISAE